MGSIAEEQSFKKNIKEPWATLNMIKVYKSWLKSIYISRSENLHNEKFEVRRLAWLNFGHGEVTDLEGKLELTHHPETFFTWFNTDTKDTKEEWFCSTKKANEGIELQFPHTCEM